MVAGAVMEPAGDTVARHVAEAYSGKHAVVPIQSQPMEDCTVLVHHECLNLATQSVRTIIK